jgi:hypothetical protein
MKYVGFDLVIAQVRSARLIANALEFEIAIDTSVPGFAVQCAYSHSRSGE